jgi:hypothetical protein
MRRFWRSWRRTLKTFVFAFVVAAVFSGTASAVESPMPPGYAPEIEAELAMMDAPSFSRITSPAEVYAGQLEPGHIAGAYRAYVERNDGVAMPSGFPQSEVTPAAVSSEGVDRSTVALGLGLGLILATACAVFVAALRTDRSHAVHA